MVFTSVCIYNVFSISLLTECQRFTCSVSCLSTANGKLNTKTYVDKKNQLDVTFCIIYFSSTSFPTCFGQPCTHHQQLTTAWCYSLVLVCELWNEPIHGRTTYQLDLTTFLQPRHIPTRGYNITQPSAPDDGHTVARNMLSNYYKRNKEYKKWHLVGFSYPHLHCCPSAMYHYIFSALEQWRKAVHDSQISACFASKLHMVCLTSAGT